MLEGFNNEPIYAAMALLGTSLFLLKMIMLFAGGDSDADIGDADVGDADLGDSHMDGAESFTLVSVQSILAFFMGAGWMGLACREEWMLDKLPAMGAAVAFGFAMMVLSSYLNLKIKSLNANPVNKIDENAVGHTGRAYTNIPAKGEGMGQVEITLNGKQQILQANSAGDAIKAFTNVKVVKVDDSGNLTVKVI